MKTRKLTTLGLSVALALILSYVESLLPPLMAVPGVKVGLPNVVILFLLAGRRRGVCPSSAWSCPPPCLRALPRSFTAWPGPC